LGQLISFVCRQPHAGYSRQILFMRNTLPILGEIASG